MIADQPIPENVEAYIAAQPRPVQVLLKQLRKAIKSAAPGATESISYRMPAYTLQGVLVYFSACKQHIGFYPTSSGVTRFQRELSAYNTSKGAIQFPLDRPLPLGLVSRIVAFRVQENLEKQAKRLKNTGK